MRFTKPENSPMYVAMVDAVRKKMAKEGKNFDEELQAWRRIRKNARIDAFKETTEKNH